MPPSISPSIGPSISSSISISPSIPSNLHTNTKQYVTTEPPMVITTSEFNIHMKEIVILSLFFLLLVYSVVTFLTKWSKNYRDTGGSINQTPYYSTEDEENLSSGED